MNTTTELDTLRMGPWRLRLAPWSGLGLIVEGLTHEHADTRAPLDYVNDVLLTPEHREAFLALVDRVGLVVCRNTGDDDSLLRDVRGRSSRGRLSQGEYYHHDGCSGPTKPRVVEIRCPYQKIERHTATAIAPFPEVVYAMLRELPASVRDEPELVAYREALERDGGLPEAEWDVAQGAAIRAVRRGLEAEDARAYLRAVDLRVGAFREPWTMGESRFIANANTGRTMQHRRAYLEPVGTRPNGRLAKRWPDGPDHE